MGHLSLRRAGAECWCGGINKTCVLAPSKIQVPVAKTSLAIRGCVKQMLQHHNPNKGGLYTPSVCISVDMRHGFAPAFDPTVPSPRRGGSFPSSLPPWRGKVRMGGITTGGRI